MLRSATRSVALLLLACVAALAGCRAEADRAPGSDSARDASAAALVDDFGDTLAVQPHGDGAIGIEAQRVVSLNPTTTEIVFALGLGDRLVGRSRWDAWPAEAARVPAVGDGIRPNVEAILATRPTIVVLYASADNRPAARALRAAGVATLAVRRATNGASRPTVLWRAWDAPLMVIGGGSYFTELVEIAGGRNAFADDPRPSPQVSFEEVLRRNPDRVLAGDSAAAAAMRADARWRTVPAVRDGRLLVVDGDLLARPSVRLGEAAVHLASRLHPELAGVLQAAPAAP